MNQCEAKVWKREQLRYTGRGKNGLERHYTEEQCRRHASQDGLCSQHAKQAGTGRWISRVTVYTAQEKPSAE